MQDAKTDSSPNVDARTNTPPSINVPVVVTLLSVCGLLVVSQLYLFIPLVGLISQVFEVSVVSASWIGSAFGFAYALGFLVFGPLSDRYSRKKILLLGLGVLAAITFAVGASPSLTALIQLRAVQGFVAAIFAPTALAYLGENLPTSVRPIGIACMSTGFLLAGIVGQIYADAVSGIYGWRWVFWLLAIAYAIAAFSIAIQLPHGVSQKLNTNALSVYQKMLELLTRPALLSVYMATFVLLLSFVAMYSGLGAYLENQYSVDQNDLFLIRLAGIPGMLFSPMFGKFIQKWGSRTVVSRGLLLAATGLALESFVNQLPIIVFASGVFVAGISATVPALISLVSSLAADARGAAVALYSFILFIGASFGPLLDTVLRPAGFKALCVVLMFSLLMAAAVVQRGVRRTVV